MLSSVWDQGKLSHGFETLVLGTTLLMSWAQGVIGGLHVFARCGGSTCPQTLETTLCHLEPHTGPFPSGSLRGVRGQH